VRIYTTASAEVKKKWEEAIEGKWSNHYAILVAGEKPDAPGTRYPITISLEFVTEAAKADYKVTANSPGTTANGRAGLSGTTRMNRWGTSDTVDITHEFGHMLGNHEDYFTTNGHDYTRGGKLSGFRDEGGGIMNNPSEDPFARHYDLIRQHAAKALKVADSHCTVEPAAASLIRSPGK
jgi:hypothetical protein